MDFQSNNLTIPRGKIFFSKFLTGTTTPGPMRELGNCPEFTLSRESEKLSHYSSQAGLRVLDDEVIIDATLNGSVVTDDIKAENAAYWFMSEVTTVTASALTTQSEEHLLAKVGDHFQVGRSDSNPTGHRKLTNVTVTDGATPTPAALDLGTDYTIDTDLGIVSMLTDQPKVVINYDTVASTRQQIAAGEKEVEGELKFVSFNAVGPQGDITIPRARLSPNGDLSLLNDPESTEFQTLPLSITVLKKGNLALAYREGRAITS